MTTLVAPPDPPTEAGPTSQQQAGVLLGHVAGYLAHRVVDIGLRSGLIASLAATPGATTEDLADALGLDDFYVGVWCRAAFGASVLERRGSGYALASHMDTLLLDTASAAHVGGLFPLVQQPEMFDRFCDHLASGERMWWADTSPAWIAGVADTGRAFYTRLVPDGLAQVPGLADRLATGCRVLDTACGSGLGVQRLAETYPNCTVIGVDGDAHSIEGARQLVTDTAVADRVEFVLSPLEQFHLVEPATVVVNNISMHECRDINRVTENILAALEPAGWFVISDFPFPDTDDGLRTVPGRIMSGIQFFEAQIDDQLLPRKAYDDLLTRHDFLDIGSTQLSPVHALTWGRKPTT